MSGILVTGVLVVVLMGACSWTLFGGHSISVERALGKENIVPIVILGSGPAGLSSALYAIRGGVKAVVIQGPLPGGLLTQTSLVENWPGNVSIQGPDIIKGLEEQVKDISKRSKDVTHKIDFLTDTVISIDFDQWPYKVSTENGVVLHAMSIIVATGANPKLLGVPGEQEYWKNGVTSCAVCDGPFYKDQDVVVVGGGDSAAEEAMQLARHAKQITILVRKDSMRASSSMQERLKDIPTIRIMYNVEVKKIVGENGTVVGVELYNNKTNETSQLKASGVFLAVGHTPNSAVVAHRVKTDAEGYIVLASRSQATNVRGVFAAGDVADRVYRQAGVASGHGIQAGLDALAFLTDIGYNARIAQELKKHFYLGQANNGVVSIKSMPEFEKAVAQGIGMSIIKFSRPGCESCVQMAPIFEKVAQKYGDKASFFDVDTLLLPELSQKLHVYGVPTLFVYRDGNLVSRYNGSMEEAELENFIKNFLL